MKVFIDNNLPPRLARALHILVEPEGHEVVHLRDRFPENSADTEWITRLGAEGDWVVITSDLDVSRSHIEKAFWRRYGLVAFLLTKGFNSFSAAGGVMETHQTLAQNRTASQSRIAGLDL